MANPLLVQVLAMHTCLGGRQWRGPAALPQAVVYVLTEDLPQRRLGKLRTGNVSRKAALVRISTAALLKPT